MKLINYVREQIGRFTVLFGGITSVTITMLMFLPFIFVGILENTFSNDIIVYPNPTDGIVKIDLGETLTEFMVSIMDVNGKLVRQSIYKNTKMFELNLNVQPGIYLLTINSGNNKATIRLIKN